MTQLDATSLVFGVKRFVGSSSEAISTARLPAAIELINSVAFCPHSGWGADGARFHFFVGSVGVTRKDL